MTISILINRYLNSQQREGKSVLSLSAYATDLKQFAAYVPTIRSQISLQSGFERYRVWCTKKHSPNSAARKLTTIRNFLSWIYQKGHINTDLSVFVKLPRRVERHHSHTISDRAIKKLRSAATVRERLLLELLLQTGMRLSDAVNIRMNHLDIKSRRLMLPQQHIQVSMTSPLYQALEYYLAQYTRGPKSALLSATRSTRPITIRTAAMLLKNLEKRAEVSSATSRNIRTTFIEKEFEAGVPTTIIQQVVGLKTPAALEHYLRPARAPRAKNTLVALTEV